MSVCVPRNSLPERRTVLPCRLSAAAPFGFPSFTHAPWRPPVASFVHREIASRCCCAANATIPTVRSYRGRGTGRRSHAKSAAIPRNDIALWLLAERMTIVDRRHMQVSTGPQWRLVPGRISPVPKAYIVASINVADPDGYEEYVNGAVKVTNGAGGTLLVSGGRSETNRRQVPQPHRSDRVREHGSRPSSCGRLLGVARHAWQFGPRIRFGHRRRRIELGAPASM